MFIDSFGTNKTYSTEAKCTKKLEAATMTAP